MGHVFVAGPITMARGVARRGSSLKKVRVLLSWKEGKVYQADTVNPCLLHWGGRGKVQEGQEKKDL